MFQQDGCGVHTSVEVQKYLDRYVGKGRWSKKPPAPCKEVDQKGNVVKDKVVECKNGQVRHCSRAASVCNCKIPKEFFHPALSPDMAPGESFWAFMEAWLNRHPAARTRSEFEHLIAQAWEEVPMEYIQKIVAGYPSRLRALFSANGGRTRF
eukprot:c4288_g1_i1.p1 GENE.c4288_g1_i1~~c4288_g1_i1.p1  ORF type:complete len:152 (-),score=12.52 c4288_g1_i1:112-567(-)